MKYRLVYTHRAIKDIDTLDTSVKHRIGKTLQRYEQNPLTHAEPLKQSDLGSYRFRIGDYRVLYLAKFEEAVYVLHVFEKRSQKTPKGDIQLAKGRYADLLKWRKEQNQ